MTSLERVRVVIGSVVVAALLVPGGPATAQTAAERASGTVPAVFPSVAQVKSVVRGTGAWDSASSSARPVGARPATCRSDLQFGTPTRVRTRSYWGRQQGMPASVRSSAEVVVLRYPTLAAAQRSVRRHASYPERCHRVVEWWCTECDGVSTTWRDPLAVTGVGQQRTGYRFRDVGNFKSNGHTVVARHQRTVVRVTVTRTRDVSGDDGWVYPPMGGKWLAIRLARAALDSAS